MKFSVASDICEPVADDLDCCALFEGPVWVVEGSATVAGRLTRRRSVALGHSICNSYEQSKRLQFSFSIGVIYLGERTSHLFLNVSKSTNSRDTVSSFKMDLYWFSSRLHNSVYSLSGSESLI